MATALSALNALNANADLSWDWNSAWPAPAKLNLFLHVVGRRADGYHLLQTVFRFIGQGDTLRFTPRDDQAIVLANPLPGVPADTDLTVRAARLLRAAAGRTDLPGVTIHLDKRLPLGGGLGGGSSDAATVLLALNHLWQLGCPRPQLQQLGLSLGADVPVFIFGQNAFAEGVGEALTAIDLPPAWYVVIEPGVMVPTAEVFRDPALPRATPLLPREHWRPGLGGNDLQGVVAARHPEIAAALGWLSEYGHARMTGSGACVFAEFAEQREAEAVCSQLPSGWCAWLAPGLAAHPLAALPAAQNPT